MTVEKTLGRMMFDAARSSVKIGMSLAAITAKALEARDFGAFIEAATLNDASKDKDIRRKTKVKMTQELRRQSKDEDKGTYLAVEKDKASGQFVILTKRLPSKDEAAELAKLIEKVRAAGYTVVKNEEDGDE